MFKKFTSWLVMISYITNVMSFAYIGLLFSLIVPSQTFAATSPVEPVSLEYTCPAGMNLIAGKCKKTEKTSLTEYCEGGYYRSGDVCVRNEEEPATVQCPVGYTFNVAPFPDECTRYLGPEYSADMPGQTCMGTTGGGLSASRNTKATFHYNNFANPAFKMLSMVMIP